jgi:hypothetical protein
LALGLLNGTLTVADNPISGFPNVPINAVAAALLGGV